MLTRVCAETLWPRRSPGSIQTLPASLLAKAATRGMCIAAATCLTMSYKYGSRLKTSQVLAARPVLTPPAVLHGHHSSKSIRVYWCAGVPAWLARLLEGAGERATTQEQ